MNIEITLSVRTSGNSDWSHRKLTAHDYFDLKMDEIPEVDSVPIHAHAVDYLAPCSISQVTVTRINITDTALNRSRIITEVFWKQGQNRLIERQETSGTEVVDWELIFDITFSDVPLKNEVLRIGKANGLFEVISHCLIEQNPDGSESEQRIHPN